jgi:hypothetical protein
MKQSQKQQKLQKQKQPKENEDSSPFNIVNELCDLSIYGDMLGKGFFK